MHEPLLHRSASFLAAALTAIAALAALAPARAHACSCMQQSQRDAFEQAVAVFEGHVLEVKPAEVDPENGRTTVRLKVVQAWKGTESEEVVLGTPGNSAACGYTFEPGQSYLVYASAHEGKLDVSLCSRTARSADAAEDFKALGLGATPVDPKAAPPVAPAAKREPPARGGCAGCTVGASTRAPAVVVPLLLALYALYRVTCRRRSGSRS